MKYRTLWTMLLFFITLINSQASFAAPPVYVEDINDALALSESTETDLLVVFGADWCGHCVSLKKDIAKNESVVDDHIVCYVNVDKNKDLAKEYRVRGMPDCMILRKKIEIKRKVGYESLKKFREWIQKDR